MTIRINGRTLAEFADTVEDFNRRTLTIKNGAQFEELKKEHDTLWSEQYDWKEQYFERLRKEVADALGLHPTPARAVNGNEITPAVRLTHNAASELRELASTWDEYRETPEGSSAPEVCPLVPARFRTLAHEANLFHPELVSPPYRWPWKARKPVTENEGAKHPTDAFF